jgi:uncharacterized membrane protein YfcA
LEYLLPILFCAVIGLGAGVVGGIAGIGGSIIMLPALVFTFGAETDHHVYQGAAMIVNAVVAYSASRQHRTSGAIRAPLFVRLWPSMALAAVATVWFSKSVDSFWPRIGLAGFLLLYCGHNLFAAMRRAPEFRDEDESRSLPLLVAIGVLCGSAAGFLAVGGGILMVPLLQILGKVQLKRAIATSAAVMAVTSPIGATAKMGTIVLEGQDWRMALLYAAGMALGAIGGARLGVILNQKMTLPRLRIVLSVILAAVAAKMAYDEIGRRAQRTADHAPPAQSSAILRTNAHT